MADGMVPFSPLRFRDELRSHMRDFTERQKATFVTGCARRVVGLYEPFATSASAEALQVLNHGLDLAWQKMDGGELDSGIATSAKDEIEALLRDEDECRWEDLLLLTAAIAVRNSIDVALGAEFQHILWTVDQLVDSVDCILREASDSPDYIDDLEAHPLFSYALGTLRYDLDVLPGNELSSDFLAAYRWRVEEESKQVAFVAKSLLPSAVVKEV